MIKDVTYKRRYRMRAVGEGGLNIVVSIPRVVIEREAERRGLTVGGFLEQFRALAQFDNFDGVLYTFVEGEPRKPEPPQPPQPHQPPYDVPKEVEIRYLPK